MTSPGRVLDVTDDTALVEIDHRRRRASVVLVPDVAVGDWVIVSTGMVLEILEPDDAAQLLEMLQIDP